MSDSAPALTAESTAQPNGASRRARLYGLVLLPLLLVAAWLAQRSFQGYVFDDAYITYRYAQNLAAGKGFVFNPGEPVFGTTTPLTALLLAVPALLGVPPHIAGAWLFCLSLATLALLGAAEMYRAGKPGLGVLLAALIVGGSGSIYSHFGLETPLHACLLFAVWSTFYRGRQATAGMLLGIAFVCRYDAVVLGGTLVLVEVIRHRRVPWRFLLAALPVALSWLVFATWTFGSPLPNTLAAKSADHSRLVYLGESLARFLRRLPPPLMDPWRVARRVFAPLALAAALLTAGRRWRSPQHLAAAVFLPLLWLGYGVIAPPLEHTWYFYPLVPLVLWLALDSLPRESVTGFVAAGAAAVVLLVTIPGSFVREAGRLTGSPVYQRRIGGTRVVAAWLRAKGLTDRPLLTHEPGYLTYLTDVPIIDGAGLVTPGIRHHGPREERTAVSDILATYHPDTVVLPQQGVLSTDLSGFRLAFSWLTKQLWLSPRAYATALPELVGPLAAGRADHPLPVAHRHPLELATGTGTPPPFRSSIPGAMLATIPGLRTPDGAAAGAVLQTERLARPYATLESELFEIDFDELRFDFYGEGPATRAELVVNGVPLLTRSGGRRDARLQTVRFPVRAWRGTAASLRLVDGAARGYLAVDRVRSVRWADEQVLCDGESFPLWPGHPAGAVVDSSTLAASFGLGMVAGERTLTTLGRQGARRLQSATFRIDAPTLMLLFLDHSARGELALRVGTEIVRREKARDQRSWVALDWNVRRWMGQDATLELVDDDPVPEAGVGVDAIVLVAD